MCYGASSLRHMQRGLLNYFPTCPEEMSALLFFHRKQAIHDIRRDLLHVWDDMCVDAQRDRNISMPQHLADYLHVDASTEENRRRCVA